MPTVHNLFELPATVGAEERFETLAGAPPLRVERILSPPGQPAGEWYDQEHDEWVVLLRGRAALEIAGEVAPIELGPGDHLLLPAHLRHRVLWTAADEVTVWLAVHYPRPGGAGAASR